MIDAPLNSGEQNPAYTSQMFINKKSHQALQRDGFIFFCSYRLFCRIIFSNLVIQVEDKAEA